MAKVSADPIEELAAEYVAAVLAGSRERARAVVQEARGGGTEIRTLYLELFQPALREVGRLWEENRITVAEEHLATAITQGLMAQLYGELFFEARSSGRSAIAACVDAERHEVGLRMVCDLLEIEGWDTTYLGATVPAESLVALVAARRPDVVALSISLAHHASRLRATIGALRERMGDATPLVIVGGRPFLADPSLREGVGADMVALDAGEAVQRLGEHFAR